MVLPNYTPGIGGLATNRYDFESHIEGLAFRHNSIQIDVNPAVVISGVSYITVADALNALAAFAAETENNGTGFLAIPDGYDTYANANGNPNYNPAIPSLDTFLNPLFTYILNYYNNPNASNLAAIPSQYRRIKDGGVVLIPAGTYTIKNTVNVPPGISIVGESFGTKIVNLTSPQAPMFIVFSDVSLNTGTRITDKGVDATGSLFMFARRTEFFNLMICDNFPEPVNSGDTTYRNPRNITQPLILVNEGASLSCNNVRFLGKTTYSGGNIAAVSAMPIGLNSVIPSTTGTSVSITNCIIDGFAQASQFNVIGSAINSYFTATNNQIRVYGFLNQNGSTTISPASNGQVLPQNTINVVSTTGFPTGSPRHILVNVAGTYQLIATNATPSPTSFTSCSGGVGTLATNDAVLSILDNCFFNLNNCNINISNNYCYGNKNNVNTLVYLYKGATDAVVDSLPSILISNNNVSIDRITGSTNFSFFVASNDASIFSFVFGVKYSSLVVSNNDDIPGFSVSIDTTDISPQMSLTINSVNYGQSISNMSFDSAPTISAAATAGSPGTFSIVGQNTSLASTSGGGISIAGGSGTTTQGNIVLSGNTVSLSTGTAADNGAVNINSNWTISPIQTPAGPSGSPLQDFKFIPLIITTVDASVVPVYSFPLGSNSSITSALVEVKYTATAIFPSFNIYFGRYYAIFYNDAGSTASASDVIYPVGGAAIAPTFTITGSNPATCAINVQGIPSTTIRWELMIEVMIG